jgi:hypothetical protein
MSIIDIAGDAEAFLKSHWPNEYDFDASGLTVSVGAPVYSPPNIKAQQPTEVWSETWTNCTQQPDSFHIGKTVTSATSMSVKLEATLKLGRNMGSTIKPIVDLILTGGFNVQLELTGSGTVSRTGSVSVTIDTSIYVAPCTVKTYYVMESVAVYTIDFTIPVDVGGFVHATVPSGSKLMFDYTVSAPYRHHYDIKGQALVYGAKLDAKTAESRAKCEAGTSCYELTHGMTDGEFWKRPELKTAPKASAPPQGRGE